MYVSGKKLIGDVDLQVFFNKAAGRLIKVKTAKHKWIYICIQGYLQMHARTCTYTHIHTYQRDDKGIKLFLLLRKLAILQ